MERLRARRLFALTLTGALLGTTTTAGSAAPRPQASHGQKAASSIPTPCIDVSWLNLPNVPPFVMDVPASPVNCDFHELAYQNFFALNLGSTPAITTWPTTDQAYPSSGTPSCGGSPLASSLQHKLAKGSDQAVSSSLNDVIQATGQALVDQNGRYVQYEIRVNPQLCQVISSCQLYTSACIKSATSASNPQFRFPVGNGTTMPGVAEVKTAWRVMETCNLPDSPKNNCKKDDLSQFVTVPNVTVAEYSPTNSNPVTVTVGMVGFHLAQKTPNRPELIWGTWEHVSNAPVCPGSGILGCADPSKPNTSGISTASGWSFTNPPVTLCPKGQTGPNCANIVQPNPTATQTATNVCRVFPCGSGSEAGSANEINITTLNAAVRLKVAGTVWANYFLAGTLWGGGATVQGDPSVPNTGSVLLANTTMETYFQAKGTTQGHNCFTCHNYAPSYEPDTQFSNLDFVHSIVRAKQKTATCGVNIDTCAGATSTTVAVAPIHSKKK